MNADLSDSKVYFLFVTQYNVEDIKKLILIIVYIYKELTKRQTLL